MSTVESRWDLSAIDISKSATDASLRVVERLTRQKEEVTAQWATAIRLAHANGASLRDIAAVAGVAPQTVAKVCKQ